MVWRKVTKRDDGTKVVETKRTTKTKYPNGELDIHHKKSGRTEQWRFTTEEDVK